MATKVFEPGQMIGERYRLERELGRGAMGVVFQATHHKLGNRVAIKFLDRSFNKVPEVVERFVREGRAALSIGHPGVVGVLDFGELADGTAFLVMEHLDGLTLRELFRRTGPLKPGVVSAVLLPVLEALEAAHAVGVIHRDLKPSNVMLTTRRAVKIVDFGISKMNESKLTSVGVAMGTPDYMSPEQTNNAVNVTSAADLYSVGVMAFELLSGRLPLIAESVPELMYKVLTEAPPPLAKVVPGLNSRLTRLVDALLLKDPAARPRSAGEVRQLLAAAAPPDAATLWTLVATPDAGGVGATWVRPSPQPPGRTRATDFPAAVQKPAAAPAHKASRPPPPNRSSGPVTAGPGPAAPTEQVTAVPPRPVAPAPAKARAAPPAPGKAGLKQSGPADGWVIPQQSRIEPLASLGAIAPSKEGRQLPPPAPPKRSALPMVLGAIGLLVVVGGGIAFFASRGAPPVDAIAEKPEAPVPGPVAPVPVAAKPAEDKPVAPPPAEKPVVEKAPEPPAAEKPVAEKAPEKPAAEKAPEKPAGVKVPEKSAAEKLAEAMRAAQQAPSDNPPPPEKAAATPPAEKPVAPAPEKAPPEKAAAETPPVEKPVEKAAEKPAPEAPPPEKAAPSEPAPAAPAEPPAARRTASPAAGLFKEAQAAIAAQDLDTAKQKLQQCRKADPENADCVCALAEVLTTLGESEAAATQSRACSGLKR